MNKSDYIYNLLLKDNGLQAKLKKLEGNFDGLNTSIESINQTINNVSANVSKGLGQVDGAINKTAGNIDKGINSANFVAITDVVRNTADAFKALSASGSTFEQSMANLSASTGITGKDLEELNRIARESGVATGAGAAEAANAFTQLASKVKVSKVGLEGLKTLQQETVTLAQAGGIGMTDAASALGETVNQFGLGADQANRVINILAAGSQSGSASIAELAASLGTTGAAATATGVSVEQAAGALEVLSQNNLKGAEAGTALSGILTSMQSSLNIDLSQTGLSTALESLAPLLGNTAELSRIFGEANVGTAEYLIQNATSVAQMTTALTDSNVAQEQAAIRSATMAEKMQQVQATIDNYKISLFEATGGVSAYAGVLTENAVVVAQLSPLFTGLGSMLGSLKTQFIASGAAATAHGVIQKTQATVTGLVTTAQKALNTAMKANPIGLVVTAITLLVSGLVIAYEHFESFRKVVDSTVDSVKSFFGITSKSKETSEAAAKATSDLATSTGQVAQTTQAATQATLESIKTNETAATTTGNVVKANETLNTTLEGQGKQIKLNLGTLDGLEQKIAQLGEKQKTVSQDEAIAIGTEIRLLKEKKDAMENAIIIGSAAPSTGLLDIPTTIPLLDAPKVKNPKEEGPINAKLPSTKGFGEEIDVNTQKVASFTEAIWGSNSVIGQWAENATSGVTRITDTLHEFGEMLKDETLNGVQRAVGSLQAMGALMSGMAGIVEGSAGSWLSYGANILAMVAAVLPQLLALFGVESAIAIVESGKSLPFPLNLVAIAATVAGIAAAVIAIPKPKAFANGGLVYGNTFAQVGEYPGAANNPEVIAPLNRLRQLIQPAGGGGGVYEFRLRGRDFVAVADKYNNINNRTR